jgi:glycosyltransferase involved in cell wall biosynthesis
MRRRLVILTEIISPYRIPLFNELARHAEVDLQVIFLAETDPVLRQWQVYKDEIRFPYRVLWSWRKRIGRYNVLLNHGVSRALRAAAPDVILCGGYSYIASWQALLWSRVHNIPFLLWSESNLQDLRHGYALVEFLKDEFLHRCTGFVVPGLCAREYLRSRKLREGCIFTAPNAIDNCLFAKFAADARQSAAKRRTEFALPEHYILFVGRLVREKGVFDLLSAYAKLDEPLRRQMGLVFVGDGIARERLQEQAAAISPGVIKFPGFAQREQLGTYFALSDALVLPTYSDPWGLVVNEAMACGLPVIVSQAAGCARDLVKENWNGLLVTPGDLPALTAAIQHVVEQPGVYARMGANSFDHISHCSPAEWSLGIAEAIAATGGHFD